jgi:hypothetical protein
MIAVAPRIDRAADSARSPECVSLASVFQDELMEQPPSSNAAAPVRQRAAALTARARAACHGCPLLVDCLYRAVVEVDVAGFVAGTTERQRLEIRRRLGVSVAAEDLDSLVGVTGGHRSVDHEAILRLRRMHPDESLEKLAHRLGCSLSTVKRHLRQERRQPSRSSAPAPKPSVPAVLAATGAVVGRHAERLAA